jgi:GT2 family glycosyltransferase
VKVSIIVLNYNGEALLPLCLPSIIEAKNASKYPVSITIIDNESTDNSLEILRSYNDQVDVVSHENRVFCSYNDVLRSLDDDIVVLLNNDIKVAPDFIDPLVEVFEEKPDAFLVGPKVFTFDGKRYEGTLSKWWIEAGVLKASSRFQGYEKLIDKESITAQAGFGAFDREKVLEIGGYDDLYLPGIMEDADLCFRAWKTGYRAYYEPGSRMYHKSQAAFGTKFGKYNILKMSHRNTYLFMWKNIADPWILIMSVLWAGPRMLAALIKGRFEMPLGFFAALKLMPEAIRRRKRMDRNTSRTDREVLDVFKNMGKENG